MKVKEKVDHLLALERKRASLVSGLRYSTLLLDLWPEVFDHGQAHACIVGNYHCPDTFRLRVRNEHEARRFPLGEVPEVLRAYHLDTVDGTLSQYARKEFRRWRKSRGY